MAEVVYETITTDGQRPALMKSLVVDGERVISTELTPSSAVELPGIPDDALHEHLAVLLAFIKARVANLELTSGDLVVEVPDAVVGWREIATVANEMQAWWFAKTNLEASRTPDGL